MKCLHRLYARIENNGFPGCCKEFLKQVYIKKGKLKIDPDLLQRGSDSGPLLKLEIIEQDPNNNKVDLTKEAYKQVDNQYVRR